MDLASSAEAESSYAYAIFKLTYSIKNNQCQLVEPEPLLHDIRDEELKPRLRSDSDFFDTKEKTDIVVQGSAFAEEGRPVTRMLATVQVGQATKRVQVFGHRDVKWNGGGYPKIMPPQPFFEIPLTYENAYGGLDWRVIDENVPPELVPFLTETDHPGMYPRNPFGKGYLVLPGEVPEMAMPCLENPAELLTEERLILRDPTRWYQQPVPWCFEWTHPATYPRFLYFDPKVDAWHPAPKDADIFEIRNGYLESNYRELTKDRDMCATGPAPQFYQGASLGMIFENLETGCPISICGMHPKEKEIRFSLPNTRPAIKMEIEGKKEMVTTRLHTIAIRPAEKVLTMVFAGSMPLTRTFIPGIHKHIPISASINDSPPVAYQPPKPILERLKEAKQTEDAQL